jgi:hypothetical protein
MTEPDDRRLTDELPAYAPGETNSDPPLGGKELRHPSFPVSSQAEAKRTPGRGTSLASLLTAVGGLGIIGLVLVICSVGNIAGALLIAGGIFGFALCHYLIWGWWLGDAIRRRVEADERAEEAD